MTAGNSQYVDYVTEQLAPLKGIANSRFFGGVGLSCEGTQFAMIMGSVLYFVVNETTRAKYESMGGDCFSYSTKKGRIDVKKYFSVPADLIEDQERLVTLAKESIRVADAAKPRPASRSKKTGSKSAPAKHASIRKAK